jgi:hypothetical protein
MAALRVRHGVEVLDSWKQLGDWVGRQQAGVVAPSLTTEFDKNA